MPQDSLCRSQDSPASPPGPKEICASLAFLPLCSWAHSFFARCSSVSLRLSLPRAQPCAVGSPSSERVINPARAWESMTCLSPLSPPSVSPPPCRPPTAESCLPGTGLPSPPPPFTRMTDSIFSGRVCHSACGFEHPPSGFQGRRDTGDGQCRAVVTESRPQGALNHFYGSLLLVSLQPIVLTCLVHSPYLA